MGNMTVDRQVFEVLVQGIEKSQAQINNLYKTWVGAMTGMERKGVHGTAGLAAATGKMEKQMSAAVAHTNNLTTALGNMEKKATSAGAGIGFLRGGFMNMIQTGMLMSIGWQAINGVITTVTTSMMRLGEVAINLEKQQRSLSLVAVATGRSYSEVNDVIEKHIDSLADRATLTSMVTKLMSTSLSTAQIDQYIQAVKDGSAVFSDFRTEAEKQALALKRLENRVTDNIGAEFKLNQVYAETARQLGKTMDQLTVAEREQSYFTAVIKGTLPYQGAHNELLTTTAGSLQRITIEWDKLGEAMSNTAPIQAMATFLGDVISGWKIIATVMKDDVFQYEQMLGYMREQGAEQAKLQGEYVREETARNNLQASLDRETEKREKAKQSINDLSRAIEDEGFAIRRYQSDLEDVNSKLDRWNTKLKESDNALSRINSQLERKRKVLFPEEYLETEDKLKDIQNELESLASDYTRVHEQMGKTTSVREYNQLVAEAETIESKIAKLRGDETDVTSILLGEISNLEKAQREANEKHKEASDRISTLTRKQDEYNAKIKTSREKIGDWREEMILTQRNIDDNLTPSIETLESKIKEADTKLQSFITNWVAAQNLPDIVKKMEIQYTERRQEEKGYPALGGKGTPIGDLMRYLQGSGQFGIPFVPKTGAYYLHRGEKVTASSTENKYSNEFNVRVGTIVAGSKGADRFYSDLQSAVMKGVSQ